MILIPQSTTGTPLPFLLVQSSDHITALTGASPTVTISKNGAAFASPGGAITELANGWYLVAGNATDTNTLGPIYLHATAASGDPSDTVVAQVFDPVRGVGSPTALPNAAAAASGGLPTIGVTIPNATAGASGGLLIAGSNAGTTTFNALTVTNATTLSGAVSLGSTLTVTGTTSLAAVTTSGTVTLNALTVTNATTLTGGLTANITGNLSGSVGSVTGAVGSVTGAVGSVTGNVGGNVTGSVGSVVGAVGSVTGNVGGNVTGSVGSVASGGITTASFAASALTTSVFASGFLTSALIGTGFANTLSDNNNTRAITETYSTLGGTLTLGTALYEIDQRLGNMAIVGTTLTMFKRDGLTTAETFTLDSATTPTKITRAS